MKNTFRIIALLLVTFFLSSFKNPKRIIVIDAGHGGADTGAVINGKTEKDIVLSVASKIKNLNTNPDTEIILTRENDTYSKLEDRTATINKINPSALISLHANFNPKNEKANGQEIFFKKDDASKSLAEKFSKKFNNCIFAEKDFYILKNSNSPAITLELGYLSNSNDNTYLISEKGQTEIAKKILEVINEN